MATSDFSYARVPLGVTEWSVFNGTGSTMAAGASVKVDTAHVLSGTQQAVGVTPTTAITDDTFGFLVEAIPAGVTGRCQVVEGSGVVALASAAVITANDPVGPSATAGTVATATSGAGHKVSGKALTTTGGTLNEQVLIQIVRYELAN